MSLVMCGGGHVEMEVTVVVVVAGHVAMVVVKELYKFISTSSHVIWSLK